MSVNLKDNVMTPDLQRTYEISLWTLQDSFIAVLGDSTSQTRGYIESPSMQLSNDGTQELDFSLPMYIDDGITRRKSNIWEQMTDAVTIAGMRKIKVQRSICSWRRQCRLFHIRAVKYQLIIFDTGLLNNGTPCDYSCVEGKHSI